MSAKRKGSVRISPSKDEAPEITDSWIAEADLRRGQRIVRRGRPKLDNPKRLLSLRLRPEVIATWRATGPGWQTRMAEVLERHPPKTRKHAV
jgi:uncharacterized protein (DUF4415 family)